ncbi:MAG: hypothetical protein KAR20_20870, partial [Candidatus Heimdallarchaeota archaeon]|nr:hypothetical protein [Candidatus Heimdallarchaeota archaeon]
PKEETGKREERKKGERENRKSFYSRMNSWAVFTSIADISSQLRFCRLYSIYTDKHQNCLGCHPAGSDL